MKSLGLNENYLSSKKKKKWKLQEACLINGCAEYYIRGVSNITEIYSMICKGRIRYAVILLSCSFSLQHCLVLLIMIEVIFFLFFFPNNIYFFSFFYNELRRKFVDVKDVEKEIMPINHIRFNITIQPFFFYKVWQWTWSYNFTQYLFNGCEFWQIHC